MKIIEGFQMFEATNSKHCSIYSIKLQKSLYRLSNPNTCGTITSMNIWSEKYVCIDRINVDWQYIKHCLGLSYILTCNFWFNLEYGPPNV